MTGDRKKPAAPPAPARTEPLGVPPAGSPYDLDFELIERVYGVEPDDAAKEDTGAPDPSP